MVFLARNPSLHYGVPPLPHPPLPLPPLPPVIPTAIAFGQHVGWKRLLRQIFSQRKNELVITCAKYYLGYSGLQRRHSNARESIECVIATVDEYCQLEWLASQLNIGTTKSTLHCSRSDISTFHNVMSSGLQRYIDVDVSLIELNERGNVSGYNHRDEQRNLNRHNPSAAGASGRMMMMASWRWTAALICLQWGESFLRALSNPATRPTC